MTRTGILGEDDRVEPTVGSFSVLQWSGAGEASYTLSSSHFLDCGQRFDCPGEFGCAARSGRNGRHHTMLRPAVRSVSGAARLSIPGRFPLGESEVLVCH